MTVISEHLDSSAWWQDIQDLTETPIRDLIDGLDEIAEQAIPYGWLPAGHAPSTAGNSPPGRIWPARPSRRWSTGPKAGSVRCAPS